MTARETNGRLDQYAATCIAADAQQLATIAHAIAANAHKLPPSRLLDGARRCAHVANAIATLLQTFTVIPPANTPRGPSA